MSYCITMYTSFLTLYVKGCQIFFCFVDKDAVKQFVIIILKILTMKKIKYIEFFSFQLVDQVINLPVNNIRD